MMDSVVSSNAIKAYMKRTPSTNSGKFRITIDGIEGSSGIESPIEINAGGVLRGSQKTRYLAAGMFDRRVLNAGSSGSSPASPHDATKTEMGFKPL
jgi:hypothetical protein